MWWMTLEQNASEQCGCVNLLLWRCGECPKLLSVVQVNTEIVQIQRVGTPAGEAQLRGLIQAHTDATGSQKGKDILGDWSNSLSKFWQLVPPSEASSPEAAKTDEQDGVEISTPKSEERVPASAA